MNKQFGIAKLKNVSQANTQKNPRKTLLFSVQVPQIQTLFQMNTPRNFICFCLPPRVQFLAEEQSIMMGTIAILGQTSSCLCVLHSVRKGDIFSFGRGFERLSQGALLCNKQSVC